MSAERKRSEKFVRWPAGDGVPSAAGLGGLSDEEAQRVAEEAVRKARRELGRERAPERLAPSPEEVRRILASRDRGRGR